MGVSRIIFFLILKEQMSHQGSIGIIKGLKHSFPNVAQSWFKVLVIIETYLKVDKSQARIQGGPSSARKKRGEKGKGKKRGKRKRDIKKLRCHNLFFCAYIGLQWPMGAGGSRPSKRRGNIEKCCFYASKVINLYIAFLLSSLTKKYILCKDIYHDFNP